MSVRFRQTELRVCPAISGQLAYLCIAGVVTANKAVAAEPGPYVYAVDSARAPVGTTYTWTVMNSYVDTRVWKANGTYEGAHVIWAGNAHGALVDGLLLPECQHGFGFSSRVQVEIRPDPLPQSGDWALGEREVALTVTVLTTLHTNGQPGNVTASVTLFAYGTSRDTLDTVYTSIGAKDTYTKLQTLRYTTLGGQPLKLKNLNWRVAFHPSVLLNEKGVTRPQSGSASVVVQSIKLQFLS